MLDFIVILLILVRVSDVAEFPLPKHGFVFTIIAVIYYFISSLYNYFSLDFVFRIFMLDAKIIMFIVSVYLFQNINIGINNSIFVSKLTFYSFVLASFVFILFPSQERLSLLHESNYMILAMLITSISYIRTNDIAPLSKAWCIVFLIMIIVSIYAESRTGFAMIAVFALISAYDRFKIGIIPLVLAIIPISIVVINEDVLLFLMRGQLDISRIDRALFLRELLSYWGDADVLTVLFGNTVGTYLPRPPIYMHWWVEKMSSDQQIPYGLAAFQFHSAYLRLPMLVGLIPALVTFYCIFKILLRSIPWQSVLVIAIAGFSMAVFNLSSVLPFIIASQLIHWKTL